MMRELIALQNKPEFQGVDILTITGFMDDHALAAYLKSKRDR